MRVIGWIGVVLILAGLAGLVVGKVSYTTKEDVVDVGPIHATADKRQDFPMAPALGIVAIVVGGGLVFAGRRRA